MGLYTAKSHQFVIQNALKYSSVRCSIKSSYHYETGLTNRIHNFPFHRKALQPTMLRIIFLYSSSVLLSMEYYHHLQYAKKTDVVYRSNHSVNKYFLIKHFITSPQLFTERQRIRLPCIERCLIKNGFILGLCYELCILWTI